MDLHMVDQQTHDMGPYVAKDKSDAASASQPQALSQQEPGAPAGQSPAAEAGQQQDEAAQPLTNTVAEGLQDMESRRQQLHAMIDELGQVGLHFLDAQRERFLRILEGFKEDVDSFCKEEAAKGERVSFDTLAAHQRLSRAQLLVQSLGGAVCQPGGQMQGMVGPM